MALDIWVVSSGGMITMGLNAVATMMENEGWHSTIWVAEMLGIAFCVMTYLRTHNMTAMFGWGMTFVMVTALLLTPKVTVVVNDLTAPENIGRVDNVPAGLAMPLSIITGVGYTLTTSYEDIFHFPDERAYTKTGMLFASKLLQDSFTIDSRNPVLAYNMGEYTKNCVVPDIMLNHKYSMQDVMESEDVQAQIFSNPSPLRGVYWRDATGTTFMFCRDAAPRLKNLLTAESNNTGSTFMAHAVRMLPGNRAPQTVYAEQLAGSYEYFLGSSKSAQSIMMQNIAVAGLRRGLNSYVKGMNDTASMVDSPVVLAAEHSERHDDRSAPAAAEAGGEELDRREAEVLEKAVKAAQQQEEKEPEPVTPDEARSAPDDRDSEREVALAAALEELREEEAFDYRDHDLSPEREDRATMMNDEVNVMRHERSEPEPEFGHKPQKTLE